MEYYIVFIEPVVICNCRGGVVHEASSHDGAFGRASGAGGEDDHACGIVVKVFVG